MSFLKDVFLMLNENVQYAVLRNWKGLPEHCESRDIDIVISKEDYRKIEKKIDELAHNNLLSKVLFFRSERFNTMIFGNAEKHELVQLDFFFHCSARGIIIMDSETMLQDRVLENSVYHVSEQIEFLDKFLFNILLGQKYPNKYIAIKENAKNNPKVSEMLMDALEYSSIEEVEKQKATVLRRKVLKRNLVKHPLRQLINTFKFVGTNISNYLFPQGITIGFTGPDGVGKTTVMEMVREELGMTFSDIQIFHFRPTLIPNLGDTMHKAGLKKEVDHEFDKPHRGKKTNVLSSLFRLFYYIFDYIVGYWIKVRKFIYRRNVVIFDRYYTDIITDSRRSKIFLSSTFVRAIRFLVPALKYNFLVVADEEQILARKQELDIESIRAIQCEMKKLGCKEGYYIIDNNGKPENTVEEILQIIYSKQDEKYAV